MRRALLLLLFSLTLASRAQAQGGARVTHAEATYEFGQQITIRARVESPQPVSRVEVFLQAQGSDRTLVGEALLGEDGQIFYLHDLQRQPLRAFANVLYWFRITTADGQTTTTPSFSFEYYDTRFAWQQLERAPFRVHWYRGETASAQRVLDAAQEGLSAFQNIVPVSAPDRLDIYLYATYYDLQSSLEGINRHLVAGHAEPDLGLVVVVLSPGPSFALDVQQRIPHELAHILLYRYVGAPGMQSIPTWLDEGLASLVETFPHTDYLTALETAYQGDNLLPLASLCAGFPGDAAGALLAYAESQSFVQYLYQQHGPQGIQALIQAYAGGGGCQHAPEQVLGKPLNALEREWLAATFGRPLVHWPQVAAWLTLLLLVLLPTGGLALWGRR